MKPLKHARSSVAKYGGVINDYLPIHNLMDSSKSAVADARHRAIFHSAFGIFIVEKIYGVFLKNSDGREISVRDIAEDHVMEDLGFIPTLDKWFSKMPLDDWMVKPSVKFKQFIPLD